MKKEKKGVKFTLILNTKINTEWYVHIEGKNNKTEEISLRIRLIWHRHMIKLEFWVVWKGLFFNKNAGIMDLYLEENGTSFLSPTMLKKNQLKQNNKDEWRMSPWTCGRKTIFYTEHYTYRRLLN